VTKPSALALKPPMKAPATLYRSSGCGSREVSSGVSEATLHLAATYCVCHELAFAGVCLVYAGVNGEDMSRKD